MSETYIVCADLNDGHKYYIGSEFKKDDIPFIEKLISFPVSTYLGIIQPENMRIEKFRKGVEKL